MSCSSFLSIKKPTGNVLRWSSSFPCYNLCKSCIIKRLQEVRNRCESRIFVQVQICILNSGQESLPSTYSPHNNRLVLRKFQPEMNKISQQMISRYTNLLHIAKIATTKKKRNRIAKQAKISTMDCTQKLNAGPKTFYTSFPQ